jgi:exopolysaccharide biosynthesis polyprenyl glycosylphosphotransferase
MDKSEQSREKPTYDWLLTMDGSHREVKVSMPEQYPPESVFEFIPVLKGSDARERRLRSSRFAPYKIALFVQDFVVVCLAFWGGLQVVGFGTSAEIQPAQYLFMVIFAMVVLGFYRSFDLYKYRHIFMRKVHLVNLLKALFWGFLSVGIVAAIYRYPSLLESSSVLVVVAFAGVGFLLLSRFFFAGLLHLLKAMGLAFVALGVFGLVARGQIPLVADQSAVLLWTILFTVAATVLSRLLTVHLVFSHWLRRRFRRQVAIIGSGEEARKITRHIVDNNAPFWVAGFIGLQNGDNGDLYASKSILDEIENLPAVVQRIGLDDILVTDEGMDKSLLISVLDYCTSEGLSVWFSPKLMPIINVKVYIDSFCGIPMIRLCSQKHDWIFNKLKHGLDALIALPAFGLLAPLFAIIGLAIKLNSPGPVFYKATAVGKGGKQFLMYKFRSMRVNSDSAVHKNYVTKLIKGEIRPEGNQGEVLKITHDPRITWVGKVLRKTSLDELPQLINVLKGDMSLVGPRPCLPYEYEIYQDWHKKRLSIRPGITGLWQVAGRSEVAFEDMVLLDLYYLYNRSLSLDLNIAYETVFAVLTKKGAY